FTCRNNAVCPYFSRREPRSTPTVRRSRLGRSSFSLFPTEAGQFRICSLTGRSSSVMTPSPFDRLDYPSLRQSVYLNQASIGLIGQQAATAMHTFIDDVARHGNLYMSDR